ncbi:MAG TPA: hypothetical protein PLI17_14115 [Denitromonas sp.]|nr:hypothetical protein [Rhodocyclaceae bacterium]HPR07759.1 hypothetical protein [Denitromonas sp.]
MLDFVENFVVRVEKSIVSIEEAYVDVFSSVLLCERQPALQLDFDIRYAIDMDGDKIRSLPIVGEPKASKSIVSQSGCGFLEVVHLLRPGVQVFVPNFFQSHFRRSSTPK